MTDKSDTVYRTIGQLAGINVLLDPDYTPRPIKVELNGVTLEEALEITALESKTFWRPVTTNTIFVAADNPAKRKELEQSVLKTFYLTNLSQPTELQDVVNAIRAVLDVQRVQQLLSQNALVVRGTPDQIALAQKLVEDLDKARPEVIIDIAVMQVSKDRSRTLGLNPPTSATVTLQNNINTTTTTTSNDQRDHEHITSGRTNGHQPEHSRQSERRPNFQVTIPSANLSFVMGASDTKLIQNPQIRALDGQKASLEDRRPSARRDRILPARHRRRRHQPAGQHAIPVSRCRRQYRYHAARPRQRRSHTEDHRWTFPPSPASRTSAASASPSSDSAKSSTKSASRTAKPTCSAASWKTSRPSVERHSRPGPDSDPEVPLRPDDAGSFRERNRLRHRSAHHPRDAMSTRSISARSKSAPRPPSNCHVSPTSGRSTAGSTQPGRSISRPPSSQPATSQPSATPRPAVAEPAANSGGHPASCLIHQRFRRPRATHLL